MTVEIGIGDALGTDYFRLKEQAMPQHVGRDITGISAFASTRAGGENLARRE